VVLTDLTGVGQWTRGLVFRCVLGLEGCVLVPRFSSTPVATWTWPIRVVSWRRVLEAVFVLLESSSPSRRIFIGSHSLPPLSGSPYRSFNSPLPIWQCSVTDFTSLLQIGFTCVTDLILRLLQRIHVKGVYEDHYQKSTLVTGRAYL
jgi:hypothetical protein